MANNKDFIVKNAVEVGGSTKVTLGDAAAAGSRTAGYDLANAAYDSKSFSVGSQATAPRSLHLISSGTKMYTMSGGGGGTVYQYTLSTAYDVSTASYDSKSFSTTSQDSIPIGFGMKPDGTKLYMIGFNSDTVYQYTLSTAYDISTASYDSKSFNVGSQAPVAVAVSFKTDGTKMFIAGNSNDAIYQYTLSTAWDVSTASYDSVSLDISAEQADVSGMQFSSDGTVIFIVSSADIDKYTLSTAWDISTATASSLFSTSSQDTTLRGVAFNVDGTKTYVAGDDNNTIYQYSTGSTVTTGSFDLSTGNYFTDTPSADVEYTFSNAGDVQTVQVEVTGNSAGYGITDLSYDSKSADVSSQIEYAAGIAFKTDGTKMYVTSAGGTGAGDVFQYSLSTAWDVSTASYDSVSYSNGSITYGYGLQFKSDGTRLYIQAYEDDRVYEHTLSTAWDLSTTSATGNSLYYGSQTASAYDFTISSDGTKIYVSNNDSPMYQYTMSTAWDISTASYDSVTFAVSSQTPDDGWYVQFNSDGTKMFGVNADDIYQYSLSTAWDLSTASYDSVSNIGGLSAATDTGNFVFKTDGTKLYQARTGNVYQYTSSSPITITWDEDIEWAGGTAPDSPASGEKDLYTITTDDGGTTYFGVQSGDAFS